ncbi:SRPBCC family protein [Spirosoma gilvum]
MYRTLEDVDALATWWPFVYLDIKVLEPGQSNGVGKVVELFTKGWLPYTLRWKFWVKETHIPTGFTIDAFGDFVGRA